MLNAQCCEDVDNWHAVTRIGIRLVSAASKSRLRRRQRPIFWLLLLAATSSFYSTTATAQSHTVYVAPIFDYYPTCCGAYFVSTSLDAAWAHAQAGVAALSNGSNTYSATDLRPDDLPADAPYKYYDGTPFWYRYELDTCPSSGSCYPSHYWGLIETSYACPGGSAATYLNSPSVNEIIVCAVTISDIQPSPTKCKTCFGNPIYAATGQKLQVESDYSFAGLQYVRNYRSNIGAFASVASQGFVDNSAPAGTAQQQCYTALYYFSGIESAAPASRISALILTSTAALPNTSYKPTMDARSNSLDPIPLYRLRRISMSA